jgi:RNA polymerase sigma factor (sigma-70 family)
MDGTLPDDSSDPHGIRHAKNVRFEELYADVAPALYAWAELRIRPALRARLEPQDLLQEVWLRGRKNFSGFDERGVGFRAWAFRIGKNILMEALRASRNDPLPHPGWSSATGTLALDGIPENVTSFTQRLAREESVREFLNHAGALEETDRMLLIHCGLEEEACASAAPKLGLSEDAAIKRWQRLRTKLRELSWSRALLAPDSAAEPRPRSAP